VPEKVKKPIKAVEAESEDK